MRMHADSCGCRWMHVDPCKCRCRWTHSRVQAGASPAPPTQQAACLPNSWPSLKRQAVRCGCPLSRNPYSSSNLADETAHQEVAHLCHSRRQRGQAVGADGQEAQGGERPQRLPGCLCHRCGTVVECAMQVQDFQAREGGDLKGQGCRHADERRHAGLGGTRYILKACCTQTSSAVHKQAVLRIASAERSLPIAKVYAGASAPQMGTCAGRSSSC